MIAILFAIFAANILATILLSFIFLFPKFYANQLEYINKIEEVGFDMNNIISISLAKTDCYDLRFIDVIFGYINAPEYQKIDFRYCIESFIDKLKENNITFGVIINRELFGNCTEPIQTITIDDNIIIFCKPIIK